MKLNLSLDFNPETKKFKVLGVTTEEEVTPELETSEPQLILGASNYSINRAAAELLGVAPDSRISINYQPVDNGEVPVIGTEEAFGCGGGNKLSKSYTVIYKGRQNERLARFGKVFTLSPLEGISNIFELKGDKEPEQVPDQFEITEDMTTHEDIQSESELEPLTFDDDFDFDVEPSDEHKISEDALSFE